MTRPVRVILCPGALARDDGIGAGMGAGTSRIRLQSVLLSNILLSRCCLMMVFWQ